MREAIKHVFPNASHCLWAWHLHKNAYENVKNSNFLQDFKQGDKKDLGEDCAAEQKGLEH